MIKALISFAFVFYVAAVAAGLVMAALYLTVIIFAIYQLVKRPKETAPVILLVLAIAFWKVSVVITIVLIVTSLVAYAAKGKSTDLSPKHVEDTVEPTSSVAEKWIKIGDDADFDTYLIPDCISKSGEPRALLPMAILTDYKVAREVAGELYMSAVSQVEYGINLDSNSAATAHCEGDFRTRILSTAFYSGNMGKGEIVSDNADIGEWVSTPPNSNDAFWEIYEASLPEDGTEDVKKQPTKTADTDLPAIVHICFFLGMIAAIIFDDFSFVGLSTYEKIFRLFYGAILGALVGFGAFFLAMYIEYKYQSYIAAKRL